MADGTMIMLAVLATVLVLYMVQQEKKPGKMKATAGKQETASAGTLGSEMSRRRRSRGDCTNVDIGSPDFTRCSLGSGRSVVRSQPRADSINATFKKDNYNVRGGGALGNPFAVKLDDNFTKDTNRRLGAKAYPFSKSGEIPKGELGEAMAKPLNGKLYAYKKDTLGYKYKGEQSSYAKSIVEAPSRGSSRSSVTLGSTVENGMGFNQAFLGAAVSPSSLGASPKELADSTNKLDNVNEVASNTGGNLNLLHPL